MKTFVVAQIKIRDQENYKKYAAMILPTLRKFQGQIIAIGDSSEPLEGCWDFPRTVVAEFPTKEKALSWYNSREYQDIKKIRLTAATANIAILESYI